MKCAEPDCKRAAQWNIEKDGLTYCSGFCAQYDSSRRSKRTKSEAMAAYGSTELGGHSLASSSDAKANAEDNVINKPNETNERKNSTVKTSNTTEHLNEYQQSSDLSETPTNSDSRRTSDEPKSHLPVKYFEPEISSRVVMSQSMNMINESVEQLNNIRKDLHEEYKREKRLDGVGLDKIRTVCEVNKSIVSMMRLGIELVKEKKNGK